jgi:hypothetical protein
MKIRGPGSSPGVTKLGVCVRGGESRLGWGAASGGRNNSKLCSVAGGQG